MKGFVFLALCSLCFSTGVKGDEVIKEFPEKMTVRMTPAVIGEGEQVTIFTTTSTEVIVDVKSIHKKKGDLELKRETILFRIKKKETWYQGKDGREVDLTIESYLYKDGKFETKLSTIETRGNKFVNDPQSAKIHVTEFGCCGGPDERVTYEIVTGKEVSREVFQQEQGK
jgi:hypothetical protein